MVRYSTRLRNASMNFPYTYTDENGEETYRKLKEKRVVTYNPKLAEKKKYEINRMVEKAKKLKASQAKKSEFANAANMSPLVVPTRKEMPSTERSG